MRYQAMHKHNYKQKLRITHFKLHIHEMCCCFTYISKWLMIWRPQKVAAKMGDFHAISTMQIAFVEFITWVLPHEKCKYILDQHFQYRPGWRTHFSPVTVAVCITATGELDQFTDRLGSLFGHNELLYMGCWRRLLCLSEYEISVSIINNGIYCSVILISHNCAN